VKANVRIAVLISFLAIPCHALSQEISFRDTVFSIPEVLVEAERISDVETIRDRPAFVTIIPVDDKGRRVSSAGDYLARTVGVHIQGT
jgi:hypothetical protein